MKKTYKIKGMDCAACATLLEMDLEDAGISCRCSYAKQSLAIEGDHDIKRVKETVNKSGYNLIQ